MKDLEVERFVCLLDEMRGENMEGEAFLITFKKVGLEE